MSQTNWIEEFTNRGALWLHDGTPSKPHALLTSGNHSDGYIDCTRIAEDPAFLKRAVAELIKKLEQEDFEKPDIVIGSAMGAICIAYEFASQLGTPYAFTEKIGEGADKRLEFKRFVLAPGTKALVVEDVVATGSTIKKTIAYLENLGVEVMAFVPLLMNRLEVDEFEGRKLIAVVKKQLNVYPPDNCPLCDGGSKALRPKENWQELNA